MARLQPSAGQTVPWLRNYRLRLLRPQGRRGELLGEPLVEFPVFSVGRKLWLAPSTQTVPPPGSERIVEHAWQPMGKHAGRIVLHLSGVGSISEAEALAGQVLMVPEADLPPLDEDTFRIRDLIGCTLYDADTPLGTVADVQFPVSPNGRTRMEQAPDLLTILPFPVPAQAPTDDEEVEPLLVPFVRAWLAEVDLSSKRIRMHLPPGLIPAPETAETPEPDESVT